MKMVTFGGYTGRENRGCEAIARSSAALFHKNDVSVAMAFRRKYEVDENRSGKYIDKCVCYRSLSMKAILYMKALWNKVFNNVYPFEYYCQRDLINTAENNIMVHIGGDTYCYGTPLENDALVHFCTRKSIPIVLWAASIEENAIKDKKTSRILKKYDKLYIRESSTYDLLLSNGFDKQRIIKTADPAFTLEPEFVELDSEWWSHDVLGINLSPISMEENEDHMLAVNGCISIVQYILDTTDMNVVLVPHVYKTDYKKRDYEPLLLIKEKFVGENRVQILMEDYNCNQLKYIISKCKLFVAARTHASIAAYSSYVPTLVLGYSIKAHGIAKDLFGSADNFVLPIQQLKKPEELFEAFLWIQKHSEEISNRLHNEIANYQKLAMEAVDDLLSSYTIDK